MRFFNFKGMRNLCGHVVRRERLSKGMSQQELAQKMSLYGLDTNTAVISRIELGTRIVTDYELFIMSRIFEIPILEFYQDVILLSDAELADFKYTEMYKKTQKK